jgi:hypothetical protein
MDELLEQYERARTLSPASCKGPGLRQSHGTTCEVVGVGGVMFAAWG